MLDKFTENLMRLPVFREIEEALRAGQQPEVVGLPASAKALFTLALGRSRQAPVLVIGDEEKSFKFYEDLLTLSADGAQVINLDDDYAYLKVMELEEGRRPYYLAGTAKALEQKVPAPEQYRELSIRLKVGQAFTLEKLVRILAAGGYKRNAFVEQEGEFSVRGGIVDVYAPLAENPWRLEFNGDILDSLREFETFTQRSLKNLDQVLVLPCHGEQDSSSLWDYIPADTLVIANELLAAPPSLPPDKKIPFISFTLSRTPSSFSFDGQPMDSFHGSIELLQGKLRSWLQEQYLVTMVVDNSGQKERLLELLAPVQGLYGITIGLLSGGFILPSLKLAVVTDEEIFGRYLERKYLARIKKTKNVNITPFVELKENDYVVHETYGIGVYEGLKRLPVGDGEEDFLSLKYAEGDRLYVPVEKMNLVQKYISTAGRPALQSLKIYRLGGNNWQRVKAQVNESTLKLAQELLALYSERETVKGLDFTVDTHWQREFEAAFIYEETPDQRQAIEAVKKDMVLTQPMDRLVCGDVGYGKTEVAMRASFTAVNNDKQVAILVPTTILAEQHLNTFRERFADYPVRIEMLSRFRSKKEQAAVVRDLGKGLVDIIIGTHRLIQNDIKFKNLGLLVIDEEQRFGVRHKERIKQICKQVHVLTLSATPIPRTLEMSLTGIRDISIINNPPEGRLPVSTLVMEYEEKTAADAVRQEISRGGQVFYVHNRVQTIHRCVTQLEALLPEVKIRAAHGQMDPRTLEKIMADFVAKKFDVIVATTIIESGLDLPNVNTLIVDDATRFGLADLYQLRGRVGRSSRRAYSYFFYPKNYVFSQDAAERLKAIREFTQLGSGFKIAMRDLELRGAGNLLGREQSGYISRVGFDLYCKLLAENIQRLKGQPREIEITPSINLRVKAYVPVTYIAEEIPRIEVYKKLAQVKNPAELEDIRNELLDRYGAIPEEAGNLLEIMRLRIMAQHLLIEEVNEQEGQWEFIFHPQTKVEGKRLVRLAQEYKDKVHFELGPPFALIVQKGPGMSLKNILQKL